MMLSRGQKSQTVCDRVVKQDRTEQHLDKSSQYLSVLSLVWETYFKVVSKE